MKECGGCFQDKQVGYLYEVGNQGGIRRAADILGVNPSVVSRQIAQLERALQLPLTGTARA